MKKYKKLQDNEDLFINYNIFAASDDGYKKMPNLSGDYPSCHSDKRQDPPC